MIDEDSARQDDTMEGLEPLVEAIRTCPAEPRGARDRVMARIRQEASTHAPRPAGALARAWRWLVEPRSVRMSPLAAASVACVVLVLTVGVPTRGGGPASPSPSVAGPHPVQFIFVAPGASSVSLVGDFNDWSPGGTPLTRTGPAGVWSVDVPLTPGRHVYSFVVDDVWMADAFAPRAPDSDFGAPTSVVVVPGGGRS